MLVIFLIIGCLLVLIGVLYAFIPSNSRISKYGYRTPRAKMSEETYKYAQKIASKTFLFVGVVMSVLGIMFIVSGLSKWFVLEIILLIIPIVGMVYSIELKLQTFNDTLYE